MTGQSYAQKKESGLSELEREDEGEDGFAHVPSLHCGDNRYTRFGSAYRQ
jgi:hypothetical protein